MVDLARVLQYQMRFQEYLLAILRRVRRGILYRRDYVRKRKYDTHMGMHDGPDELDTRRLRVFPAEYYAAQY